MVMKRYFVLPRSSKLDLHHEIQLSGHSFSRRILPFSWRYNILIIKLSFKQVLWVTISRWNLFTIQMKTSFHSTRFSIMLSRLQIKVCFLQYAWKSFSNLSFFNFFSFSLVESNVCEGSTAHFERIFSNMKVLHENTVLYLFLWWISNVLHFRTISES